MAKLKLLSQVSQVTITEDDVLRGSIDVEYGSHVEVRSNARCRLAYRCMAAWFNRVHVYGYPRAIEFGPDGGCFVRPLERHRSSTYLLSYRFDLHPSTVPGVYRWPLTLAVTADWDEVPQRLSPAALRMPPMRPTR